MNPTGQSVAARAVALATGPRIAYGEMDCQALVEQCVIDCGGRMAYAGSNAMARGAVWLGTIENAKRSGRLVPGAGLLIHEDDESGLPAKYRGDGLGDFSHVGLYVGPGALRDADRNGRLRACDVVHSSQSIGRVAGSTLQNGWTHVIWFAEIEYGAEARLGIELGAEIGEGPSEAVVYAANGGSVKMRAKPSAACGLYWSVPCGEAVTVLERGGEWSKIRRRRRVGWMRTEYLTFG